MRKPDVDLPGSPIRMTTQSYTSQLTAHAEILGLLLRRPTMFDVGQHARCAARETGEPLGQEQPMFFALSQNYTGECLSSNTCKTSLNRIACLVGRKRGVKLAESADVPVQAQAEARRTSCAARIDDRRGALQPGTSHRSGSVPGHIA
jgi:hypothetical protein